MSRCFNKSLHSLITCVMLSGVVVVAYASDWSGDLNLHPSGPLYRTGPAEGLGRKRDGYGDRRRTLPN